MKGLIDKRYYASTNGSTVEDGITTKDGNKRKGPPPSLSHIPQL